MRCSGGLYCFKKWILPPKVAFFANWSGKACPITVKILSSDMKITTPELKFTSSGGKLPQITKKQTSAEAQLQKKFEELPPEQYSNALLVRKTQLEEIIKAKMKALTTAPKDHLRISTNKGYYQYYKVTTPGEKLGTYIPKSALQEAITLAQTDYTQKLLPQLQAELDHINQLLETLPAATTLPSTLHPGRQKLLTPLTLADKDYAAAWLSVEYNHKSFDQAAPVLQTSTGQRVRSKSEVMIAETLTRLGIPFRYEFPVRLKTYTAHPDFFCLNLKTRQEFLWEHFGMMDDPDYAQNAVTKLHDYQKCGYFPGKNLIISAETRETPLSTRQIEQLAKEYLL